MIAACESEVLVRGCRVLESAGWPEHSFFSGGAAGLEAWDMDLGRKKDETGRGPPGVGALVTAARANTICCVLEVRSGGSSLRAGMLMAGPITADAGAGVVRAVTAAGTAAAGTAAAAAVNAAGTVVLGVCATKLVVSVMLGCGLSACDAVPACDGA